MELILYNYQSIFIFTFFFLPYLSKSTGRLVGWLLRNFCVRKIKKERMEVLKGFGVLFYLVEPSKFTSEKIEDAPNFTAQAIPYIFLLGIIEAGQLFLSVFLSFLHLFDLLSFYFYFNFVDFPPPPLFE